MLDAERRVRGDWYSGTIPESVWVGDGAHVESTFSFLRYRSELSPGVRIGAGASVYMGTMFDVGPRGRVEVGACALLVAVRIECDLRIEIGEGSLLSWDVVLQDGYRWPLDPQQRRSELQGSLQSPVRRLPLASSLAPEPRPIRIGRNVWIGLGSCVCPGVSIGDDAVIGARSVVTQDVAPRTVAAGNPARIVRTLP
jgi:acetyltransferase-like isoleucine patch superfamily enzyme